MNQSPGPEGAMSLYNRPSFYFTISSNDSANILLGYRIQIDNHLDFSSPAIDYAWSGSTNKLNTITYTIPNGSELRDDPYYWRVKAIDNRGLESDWMQFMLPGIIDFIVNTFSNDTLNDYNFSGCWGVTLCGQNYTCGVYDRLCVEDFLGADSFATCLNNFGSGTSDFYKCADPDCSRTCFNGTVKQYDSNMPINNSEVSYEINVWNGTGVETLRGYTYSDSAGYYRLSLPPGNGIYVLADARGFAPALAGPFFNMILDECKELNFILVNGTCQDDCTKLGSNYCSASCHNEGSPTGICLFNTSTTFTNDAGTDVPIKSPFQGCSELGVKSSSHANLGTYEKNGVQMCVKVECCKGTPFESPCPVSNITSTDLKDAIKVSRIAKYKGQTVKINTYYWE